MDKLEKKMIDFMELVLERNERVNLTTITDRDAFIEKHLKDSLMCCGLPEIEAAKNVVDVGTGAGFPGIPLAIRYPGKEFLLIDSLGKRVTFLSEATNILGLKNVRVIHSRAEEAGRLPDLRERFDLCVSRAVAHLSVLSEYCLPLARVGGSFYAWKTDKAIEAGELKDSAKARRRLGGGSGAEVFHVSSRSLDDCLTGHNIVVVRKMNPTPKAYPRRAGVPAKAPL
jgi:16S rRNA (guanine527-N7)-methyltransferase